MRTFYIPRVHCFKKSSRTSGPSGRGGVGGRVISTLSKDDFPQTFMKWQEVCRKVLENSLFCNCNFFKWFVFYLFFYLFFSACPRVLTKKIFENWKLLTNLCRKQSKIPKPWPRIIEEVECKDDLKQSFLENIHFGWVVVWYSVNRMIIHFFKSYIPPSSP